MNPSLRKSPYELQDLLRSPASDRRLRSEVQSAFWTAVVVPCPVLLPALGADPVAVGARQQLRVTELLAADLAGFVDVFSVSQLKRKSCSFVCLELYFIHKLIW